MCLLFKKSFNFQGQLTDKSFEFAIHSNQDENQDRYEKIGEAITEHVYQLMQEPPTCWPRLH